MPTACVGTVSGEVGVGELRKWQRGAGSRPGGERDGQRACVRDEHARLRRGQLVLELLGGVCGVSAAREEGEGISDWVWAGRAAGIEREGKGARSMSTRNPLEAGRCQRGTATARFAGTRKCLASSCVYPCMLGRHDGALPPGRVSRRAPHASGCSLRPVWRRTGARGALF